MEKPIGRVTHFFPHVTVAVVHVEEALYVGDLLHIEGHSTNLTQRVESLEVDHAPVASAAPGTEVALRVDGRVREGDILYKVYELQLLEQRL